MKVATCLTQDNCKIETLYQYQVQIDPNNLSVLKQKHKVLESNIQLHTQILSESWIQQSSKASSGVLHEYVDYLYDLMVKIDEMLDAHKKTL